MMEHPQVKKPHILFLFSDTGGGHRSAAEAIIEALNLEFPERFTTEMVDIFREYTPGVLKYSPEMYPALSGMATFWKAGFSYLDHPRHATTMYDLLWPTISPYARRLLQEHPADLICSVHPVPNLALLRVKRDNRVPYVTVVTDMVSVHFLWYNTRADLTIVPTDRARKRGLNLGLNPKKIKVIGMPVADRFCQSNGDKQVLREKLGWPQDKKIVLLVGGGQGLGPLKKTAFAIDKAKLPAALVVVAGRNERLRKSMEKHHWNIPSIIYGFTKDMPDFMRASDIIVTKAGPGTISEAFIAGLPILLYSCIPGQEEGNVDYVVEEGAGVWAPDTSDLIDVLYTWLTDPEKMEQAANASRRLARPEATRDIARNLAEFLIKSGGNHH